MYRLLFEDRKSAREPYVTREPLAFIGRDESCSVRLAENGVSDRHAAIERREDGYYLRDLGSANGVRINGQLVDTQRLASGDELEVGSVRLRFEIVHEPPSRRRSLDWMQVVAVAIVVGTIAGQAWLLGWVFSETRPRHVRTDMGPLPSSASTSSMTQASSIVQAAGNDSLTPLERANPVPATPPVTSPVLNRMIKIQSVDRKDGADTVTLQIRVVAQVGERTLEAAAIAIGVQFVAAGEAKTIWLDVPANWENFAPKTFLARFAGPPRQLKGYVVRTYYRKQLQDAKADPSDLLATTPSSKP